MGEAIVVVIILLIAGVGGILKQWQDAKARAELERRRLESRRSSAPPEPPRAWNTPEAEGGEEGPAERPARSPLEEFRRFVEEAQRRQRPAPTAPRPPMPPRPQAKRRVLPAVEPVREEGEEGPSGKPLSEVMAKKDREHTAARAATSAAYATVPYASVPSATVPSAAEPPPAPRLSEILASDRSDLAKAVIVRELLGPPVGMRPGRVPLRRG